MKTMRSKRDLAINGAAPLLDEVLHIGRPNIVGRDRFFELMEGVFDSKWLTNDGPLVKDLEQRIADQLGAKYCALMSNGTVALEIAIRALELEGEVIVPSYTFIATAHALWWQRIKPVFADIDPKTHNLDPESVSSMITPRTTGIIGVHLWGRPAPIRELTEIAEVNGLKLLFDAAHAFGCSANGTSIGNFGACEVFSFHATKFFNTFEGGAIVTNDEALYQKLCLMRNFGFSGYDSVQFSGTNGKMAEANAAMGLGNIESLDLVVETNRTNYEAYRLGLRDIPVVKLLEYDESERNNYQYIVIELDSSADLTRDELVAVLVAENILARKYFWPGCHAMSPYKELFPSSENNLPHTLDVANRVVVLPTGTNVSTVQIEAICALLKIALC